MLPWVIAAATLILDQVTKLLITRSFSPGDTIPVWPPVLYLTYVQNTGAAFGIFRGWPWMFIAIAAGIIIWIGRELLSRAPARPAALTAAYGLVLGGAVGNLIDRVRAGYVIDFIDVRVWPVFNVADSAITVGVTCLILFTLFADRRGA